MKNRKLVLLPQPQKVVFKEGFHKLNKSLDVSVDEQYQRGIAKYMQRLLDINVIFDTKIVSVVFEYNSNIETEGYYLDISQDKIAIAYSSIKGIYYALVTLKKIKLQFGDKIPCLEIEDYPELEVRGVMLDIGRNRIPKCNTVLELVDMLSMLKINHFEFHVEAFPFAYPSFKELWEEGTPLTVAEIKEIDAYCQDRFIDFVPNQNCFGHMTDWLEKDIYKDLRESDVGLDMFGIERPPSTLNPLDKRSIELVERIIDDVLPHYSSEYFNANLDEPFELGLGKSKAVVEERGKGQVYLEFVKKIYEIAKKHNKKMLMWGDVIAAHPELLDQVPKDITILNWFYEGAVPFDKNAKMLQESGLDYYLCPGTSSWTTIGGRTDNMLQNIKNAATAGAKYGAKGLLNTDWGDQGHWQHQPISFAGYVYGAALSWNVRDIDISALEKYLDFYIYHDANEVMGHMSLELGRYNQFEDILVPNCTVTNVLLNMGLVPKAVIAMFREKLAESTKKALESGMIHIDPEHQNIIVDMFGKSKDYEYSELIRFLNTQREQLKMHNMKIKQAQFYQDCFANAIDMIRVGADLRYYIDNEENLNIKEQKLLLEQLKQDLHCMLDNYKVLWTTNSKVGGLEKSIQAFLRLQGQINHKLSAVG